jgi:hypothetical protein
MNYECRTTASSFDIYQFINQTSAIFCFLPEDAAIKKPSPTEAREGKIKCFIMD